MSTHVVSAKNIKRHWHHIDAKGKVLGRLAVDAASKLSGKYKTNYVPYLDNGDFVVITNAKDIKITGKKPQQKMYRRHSGFPGGFREESMEHLLQRRPGEVIRKAIVGMLPKNKLGDRMITKLHVFAGSEHPFQSQLGLVKKEAVKEVVKKEEVVETEAAAEAPVEETQVEEQAAAEETAAESVKGGKE